MLTIPASSACTCASCGPWRNCGGPGSCDRGCGCASRGCGCLGLCSSCGVCRLGWEESCCGSSSCVAPSLVLPSTGTKTHAKTHNGQSFELLVTKSDWFMIAAENNYYIVVKLVQEQLPTHIVGNAVSFSVDIESHMYHMKTLSPDFTSLQNKRLKKEKQ